MIRRMVKDKQDVSFHLAIISKGRPENVKKMAEMVGAATWYVPAEEGQDYKAAGAGRVKEVLGGLSAARNAALDDAFAKSLICVQLDDDLRWAAYVVGTKAQRIDPFAAVTSLVGQLMESDLSLAGGQPTDNAYFARGGTQLFILGSAMAVKPSVPRFDTEFFLKEDYDFTCQHIKRYGGALRCPNLIFSFSHYTNAGGAVAARNTDLEQQMIARLRMKWPHWIKHHPRRENEVLLRVPKAERTVLE